jgi:mannosyl-oligosaccharide glucosidase
LDIELDIISHWFDLMNIEGWIPREQILGSEALSRVPPEFVTQINTNANPPTFFLTLNFILRNYEEQLIEQSTRLETLDRLYGRLIAWFDWFNTTQIGSLSGTYRWHGRDANTTRELNPKTLTSGLDDYPRASHPTEDERHVDLRCWIATSAATIVTISNLLNKPSNRFAETAAYLYRNDLLNEQHWSTERQVYADYGLHTDEVTLISINKPHTPRRMKRKVLKPPTHRLVDTTFGYVSLFPFMLQIIDSNSPQLEEILQKIRDPELLWTDYGLRSLSRKSPLYMKYNTADDPPYWRGAIWMNINFLVVRALKHYGNILGPHSKKSQELYNELRGNLIKNVYKEFRRTGYLWENYNDTTGQGQGSRPFNGWTSLIILIMAEIY